MTLFDTLFNSSKAKHPLLGGSDIKSSAQPQYMDPSPHHAGGYLNTSCYINSLDNIPCYTPPTSRGHVSSHEALRQHHMAGVGMRNYRNFYRQMDIKKQFAQASIRDEEKSRFSGVECGSPTISKRSLFLGLDPRRKEDVRIRQNLVEDRLHGMKRRLSNEERVENSSKVIYQTGCWAAHGRCRYD